MMITKELIEERLKMAEEDCNNKDLTIQNEDGVYQYLIYLGRLIRFDQIEKDDEAYKDKDDE